MKMRKLIAILSAVMMLCALLPAGALVVSAAAIYSEDFESGTVGSWTSNNSIVGAADLPVANAAAGNYTMQFVSTSYSYTNCKITVAADTTYRVTFSILSGEASKPVNVRIRTGSSVDLTINQYTPSTTAWETHTLVFNSGDQTSLNFRFQAAHSTGTYYLDNLSVEAITDTYSDDGYLKNGDFETGMADNWYGTANTEIIDDPTGSGQGKVMHTFETAKVNMISQNINIVTGESYILNFKVYGYASASNSAFYVRLGAPAYTNTIDTTAITHTLAGLSDVSDSWTRQIRMNMNSNKGAWQTVSIPFVAAKDGNIPIAIYNYRENAGNYYFDDFYVTGPNNPEPDEPEEPENPDEPTVNNVVVNGDFELGNLNGWSSYTGTTVSTAVVHGGSYSMNSVNTTSKYGTMTKQTISVTANTDYTLTYWYYYEGTNAQPSFYTYINVDSSTSVASKTTYPSAAGVWEQVTLSFNSGENTSLILYVKNRTASDGGQYYFDDFLIPAPEVEEPEEPDEPGEIVDPEIPAGNLISNSTFEGNSKTGWSTYNGTAVSTVKPKTGSYSLLCKGNSWNGIAETTFNTEVGKSYQLSFWYYIETAGFNWKVTGKTTETKYVGTWINTNLGSWQQVTTEFIADDTQVTFTVLGLDEASQPVFYLDDVFAIEVQGPSNDGFIINGDFEVGKLTGWDVYQSTVISADAANGSNYGVNLIGNGGWGGMLNQSFKTKKGLKYILTLDLKVNNYGTNMQVRNVADDAILTSKWFDLANNGSWATYTFEFTAISSDTYLNFCGGGSGADIGGENVYVDNIGIVEIPCEHAWDGEQDADCNICGHIREVPFVPIMAANGTSASEDVNGLAFRFDIEALGAATDNNNKYTGTATVKPYGNSDEYKLVRMGAVMSNKNSTEATLNLNTVNGKSVVNVEAVYLLDTADTSASFAARIVNIPEGKESTEIYARCYYVFEKDGKEIVIYGDIVNQNYAAILG